MKTASEILAARRPERLFSSQTAAIQEYRDLAKIWHPDVSKEKDALKVFQHISELHRQALEKIYSGRWGTTGTLMSFEKAGSSGGWKIFWLSRHSFDLGEYYVGENAVVYLVDAKHRSLFDNYKKMTKFKYADSKMEEKLSPLLPDADFMETKDGKLAVAVKKPPEFLLLRDVLRHFDGKMDAKHVAWIGSTMYHLCCYLDYAGIVSHDISLDSLFISPKEHYGALLGGWWHSLNKGEKLTQVPARTFGQLPWDARNKKIAAHQTDLELVKATLRELMGNITGTLLDKKSYPKEMLAWVRSAASEDPLAEYGLWSGCLKSSFGDRRFTEMKLDQETLYN